MDPKKVIVIGAGKHGCLLGEKIFHELEGHQLAGFIDRPGVELPPFFQDQGIAVLGDDDSIEQYISTHSFLVGLGAELQKVRKRIIGNIEQQGGTFTQLIHPSAYVAPSASLGRGCSLLVSSIVHSFASIGDHTCVNTGAIVEHDCQIGKNVFIQPKACLAGNVKVGDHSIIGVGASVRENIVIGRNCLVGGGSYVCKDIPDGCVAYGVPARVIPSR